MKIDFKAIGSVITRTIGKGKLWAMVHEPELWIGAGIAVSVGAVVAAGVQGTKCHDIIEKHKDNIESIKEMAEYAEMDGHEYTAKEQTRDKWAFRVETGTAIAEKFVVPGIMVIGAGAMIIKGFKVEKARTRAAVKWGMGVLSAFGAYRANVIADQGAAKDKYYMTGLKDSEIEVNHIDENGKITVEKETVETGDLNGDILTKFFTFIYAPSTSYGAVNDGQVNLRKLKCIRDAAQLRMVNNWYCNYNWILEYAEMRPEYYPPRGYGQLFGATAEKDENGGWKKKIELEAHIIPGRSDGACIVTVHGMLPLTEMEDVTNVMGGETVGMLYPEDFKDDLNIHGSEFLWGISEKAREEAEYNRRKFLDEVNKKEV